MPAVTITLTDTPTNGVSVHSDFTPAVGNKLSPAQVAAMEIMLRTTKQWGMPVPVVTDGIDIDAVHRQRDNVVSAQV